MVKSPLALTVLFGLTLLGLSGCRDTSTAGLQGDNSDKLKVIGKWVVIADTSGQGHTGSLDLSEDGTFSGEYDNGETTDSMSGTYAVTDADGFITVTLTPQRLNDKAPDTPAQLRLLFDPERNILHDMMTVAYSRPGEEEKAAKFFERPVVASRPNWAPVMSFDQVWNVEIPGKGQICGVVCGNVVGRDSPEVITSGIGSLHLISADGKPLSHSKLSNARHHNLALGRRDGELVVAAFGVWGDELTTYTPEGKELWSTPADGSGIDWVASVRVDAKNTAYVIGYNGGGLQLLDPNGKSKWKVNTDCNVWSVTGLEASLDGPGIAVRVASDGAVAHDLVGNETTKYDAGDVGAVGAIDIDGDGKEEVLTLGTTVASGQMLHVFSADGELLWSHEANASNSDSIGGEPFLFGEFVKGQKLLAVVEAGGVLFFKPDGTVFGVSKFKEVAASAAVLPRPGQTDLIVVRTYTGVSALRLIPLVRTP